jgi:hypothetical protein
MNILRFDSLEVTALGVRASYRGEFLLQLRRVCNVNVWYAFLTGMNDMLKVVWSGNQMFLEALFFSR